MRKIKNLKGGDIILNLKKMDIYSIDAYSSSSCTGPVGFYFKCETRHGYMEDPDLSGEIKVLDAEKKKGHYILKIKFKKARTD